MRGSIISFLFLVGTAFAARPAPHSFAEEGSISNNRDQSQFTFRPDSDPDKTRSITFVAIGDSYSAGPGAGNRVSWWDFFNTCRRSDHSYPVVVSGNPIIDPAQSHYFDFRSCTGSTIKDLLREEDGGIKGSQLEYASLQADVTTLSISGNDVGFFDILNSCIYHFGGWGSPTDCLEALGTAAALINSTELDKNLDLVINGTLNNALGHPAPKLFVTGYARFFNDETVQCNNVTFCIWENPTKNHTCPMLTQGLRREMNGMIRTLNAKLTAAVERFKDNHANATVAFIDYDASFEGHRFCEPVNVEPDFNNPDIWFYQTWGDSGEDQKPDDTVAEPSYKDVNPDTCLEEARRTGDWGRLAVCFMAKAHRENPELQPEPNDDIDSKDLSSWIIPNQLARIFHPKIGGHQMVAQHILQMLNSTTTS